MAGPGEIAIAAFHARLAAALVSAGFLSEASELADEPDTPPSPTGDGASMKRFAAIFRLPQALVRTFLGAPTPRHIIDIVVRFEAGVAGGAAEERKPMLDAALGAFGSLIGYDETLGDTVDGVFADDGPAWDSLDPGLSVVIVARLRIESADTLGLT